MIYLLITTLLVMFYQDVKSREINILLYPIVFFGSAWYSKDTIQILQLFYIFIFLIFILTSLTVYLSIKNGKFILITNGFFSIGDCLFLLVIIPFFHFHSFLLFFTIGTFLVLILHLLLLPLFKNKTIPYAGLLGLLLIFHLFFPNWNIHFISFFN